MADSHDYRRRRSPSDSPDRDRRRRTRDEDHDRRRRDHHRSSHKDRPARRSHSPSDRSNYRKDHERRRRERRGRSDSSDDDRRRRHQHQSSEERDRHRRRHRDRDAHDERERPSRRRRSRSKSQSRAGGRRRSRSPSSPPAPQRSQRPLPSQEDAFNNTSSDVSRREGKSPAPPAEKQKPNFAPTGRLAAESNTVNVGRSSVVLKYHEPPEARKPPAKEPWRLYVFKGEDVLEVMELGERSCWLVGREHLVVDFPLDHPSCSKQHAALQFRYVEKRSEYGDRVGKVKPYVIDLDSANGTSVNGDSIPARRYIEVMDKDVIRFGLSSREYVLMLPPPQS